MGEELKRGVEKICQTIENAYSFLASLDPVTFDSVHHPGFTPQELPQTRYHSGVDA